MTMRVLQVVDSLDPVFGGPPAVVLRLAAALASEGIEVTLYSVERPGREADIQRSLVGIPGIERVRRISDICANPINRLRGGPARDFLRCTEQRFDIVHVHGLWRPTLRSILTESLRHRIPYVVSPHGMFARWSLAQKPVRKRIALALAWRDLTRRALFVHALTRAEAVDFHALSIETPVEIVPNGFFPEEMGDLPSHGAFHEVHPEIGGCRFILFLARLHYVKRADLLVRAFASVARVVHDIQLVLAGPDCGTQLLLERMVKRLGLESRIHLPGPLYGRQKYAAMIDALCFCQSSVYETFSMSILEAMACGLPPVITRGCNFDEVGISGSGIVVDGGDQELAEALLRYCTDPDARAVASQKGRDFVAARYTWPTVARQMIAAYEARLRTSG
jgi:glycosyltransferase involved in cell wall biosynthesis